MANSTSTASWISVGVTSRLPAGDREQFRALLEELDAPPAYRLAIDPGKQALRTAVVEVLVELYDGARSTRARALAGDWARYVSTTWPRERDIVELPPTTRRLRIALHKLTALNAGNSLSASTIDRIAKAAGL